MKKLLYSTLVAAMVLGFGVGAFGAVGVIAPVPFTDIAGHAAEAELTLMASLGIFTGDSGLGGTVNPNGSITRAQFCKVIVVATGKASTAAGLAGLKPTFTDAVPAWAWGYVNTAFFMGVISGYPDGSFKADNPVAYQEAVTMLVKAIPQHKLQVPAGIWPYNYIFYAVDKKFTGAVDVGAATAPCTRGDMAKMLFATMKVHPVKADGSEPVDHASILEPRMHTGTFEQFDGAKIHMAGGTVEIPAAASVYLVGATSWTQLINQPVLVVESPGPAFEGVFVQKTEGTVLAGVLVELDHDTTGDFMLLADDTKVYYWPGDTAGDVPVTLNEVGSPHTQHDLQANDELVFNLDDDGFAVQVFATRWDFANKTAANNPYWDYIDDAHDKVTTPATDANMVFPAASAMFYFEHVAAAYITLNGLTVNIPSDATVTVNGVAATANDLTQYDVIKAATLGADGYSPATPAHNPIIAVAAERNTYQGTVVSWSTVQPGTKYYVMFTAGGATQTYRLDTSYVALGTFPVGSLHKIVLANGKAFFSVGLGQVKPAVYVKTVRNVEEGVDTGHHHHIYIDVDNRGTAVTYETDGDILGAGTFCVLTIDNATGLVTTFQQLNRPFTGGLEYKVVAGGAADATLGVPYATPVAYLYCTDTKYAVYKMADGVYTFIGFGGLAVGDKVTTAVDGASGCGFILRDECVDP
jgi:hypothetical protein